MESLYDRRILKSTLSPKEVPFFPNEKFLNWKVNPQPIIPFLSLKNSANKN